MPCTYIIFLGPKDSLQPVFFYFFKAATNYSIFWILLPPSLVVEYNAVSIILNACLEPPLTFILLLFIIGEQTEGNKLRNMEINQFLFSNLLKVYYLLPSQRVLFNYACCLSSIILNVSVFIRETTYLLLIYHLYT